MRRKVLIGVVVGAWAIALVGVLAWVKQGLSERSRNGAHYVATIKRVDVLDPAEVLVLVTVRNDGPGVGRPTCKVTVSSPAGAYTGFAVHASTEVVAWGSEVDVPVAVTVRNRGASYVNHEDASCS